MPITLEIMIFEVKISISNDILLHVSLGALPSKGLYLGYKKFDGIQFTAGPSSASPYPDLSYPSSEECDFHVHGSSQCHAIVASPLVSYLHSKQVGKENNEQETRHYFRKVKLALKLPSYFLLITYWPELCLINSLTHERSSEM